MKKIILILFVMLPVLGISQLETLKEYYEDGTLQSQIEYKDGKRDGLCTHFWANGNTWGVGEYKQGIQSGEWKRYYETGQLKSLEHFVNGKQVGNSKFYNTKGNLIRESKIQEDGNVIWINYDENGKVIEMGEMGC